MPDHPSIIYKVIWVKTTKCTVRKTSHKMSCGSFTLRAWCLLTVYPVIKLPYLGLKSCTNKILKFVKSTTGLLKQPQRPICKNYQNLVFHCTHEEEQGMNSMIELMNLINLDDKSKAHLTHYVLAMVDLTIV